MPAGITFEDILSGDDENIYNVSTRTSGPKGTLPLSGELLLSTPSGHIFAMSQNVDMGWDPAKLGQKQFLLLSTQAGIRADDGRPVALGYHVGHWELDVLMQAAAKAPAQSEYSISTPLTHELCCCTSRKLGIESRRACFATSCTGFRYIRPNLCNPWKVAQ
jgi:hypothetical protein